MSSSVLINIIEENKACCLKIIARGLIIYSCNNIKSIFLSYVDLDTILFPELLL